ncbi:MAG: hypothetical protein ABI898_10855 [Sphingomonadales bacterium]
MRFLLSLLALFLTVGATPAQADIEVSFWSRELGLELPHAFFNISGTVAGRPVEESYGFTAKTITPALLWGPVPGRIDLTTKGYMASSHKLFTVTVPDEAYPRLRALVQRFSERPGSIYRMNERNCVHFVAEAAAAAGLRMPAVPKLMKRPTSFLLAVAAANKDNPTLRMATRK